MQLTFKNLGLIIQIKMMNLDFGQWLLVDSFFTPHIMELTRLSPKDYCQQRTWGQ